MKGILGVQGHLALYKACRGRKGCLGNNLRKSHLSHCTQFQHDLKVLNSSAASHKQGFARGFGGLLTTQACCSGGCSTTCSRGWDNTVGL